MWVWLAVQGCASLAGLTELDSLPADFPLAIQAETGKITSSSASRQVAVDLVFEDEAAARADWVGLRRQAEGRGFTVVEEGPAGKRDRVVLEGAEGRLQLSCCAKRADRRFLVLVSWWGEPPPR